MERVNVTLLRLGMLVTFAALIVLPGVGWAADGAAQSVRGQCIVSLSSYLDSAKATDKQHSAFTKLTQTTQWDCTAKGACKEECSRTEKNCKSARPDCKKMCKKAPGKKRKACAKSCAKHVAGFKTHCRNSKKSCRLSCGKLKTKSRCRAGFSKILKHVEAVKGGDKALLKQARRLCKAANLSKAPTGSSTKSVAKNPSETNAGSVEKVKGKGKKKITAADVD